MDTQWPLKTCPFCGCEAREIGKYSACCSNRTCPMSRYLIDIEYWNIRFGEENTSND